MAVERGPLSINSENMFPIIKKWLYSDHDIFYRELISNGCDAITKLKKLDMMGDYELPEGYKARIDIEVDPREKTIKVTDNGLGIESRNGCSTFTHKHIHNRSRYYNYRKEKYKSEEPSELYLSV